MRVAYWIAALAITLPATAAFASGATKGSECSSMFVSGTGNSKTGAKAGLKLRGKPSTSGAVLGSANEGEEVCVLDGSEGEWAKVRYKGRVGYMKRQFLSSEGMPAAASEASSAAQLTSQPSSQCDDVRIKCAPFPRNVIEACKARFAGQDASICTKSAMPMDLYQKLAATPSKDDVSLSIAVNALKFGLAKRVTEPAAGESQTTKIVYADLFGQSAEKDSTSVLELGLRYNDWVFYFYPMGGREERELWIGYSWQDTIEAGVVLGGYSRLFGIPQAGEDGKKVKSEQMYRAGIFATAYFDLATQPFELTFVNHLSEMTQKFEVSANNTKFSTLLISTELLWTPQLAKNLSGGWGINVDWRRGIGEVKGERVVTITEPELGVHLGRFVYTF